MQKYHQLKCFAIDMARILLVYDNHVCLVRLIKKGEIGGAEHQF